MIYTNIKIQGNSVNKICKNVQFLNFHLLFSSYLCQCYFYIIMQLFVIFLFIYNHKTVTTINNFYQNSTSQIKFYNLIIGKYFFQVFENSFLAASEDGRIYRYNQASNGILNIYKGHQAAVTCLYVYNTTSTDINKEWMFSGSLDGTLRCYNIMVTVTSLSIQHNTYMLLTPFAIYYYLL